MNRLALLTLCIIAVSLQFVECSKSKKSKPKPSPNGGKLKDETNPSESDSLNFGVRLPKDVAVIGAGMAGLAAARRLSQDRSNFSVQVYEAQKDRWGGRVWTDKLTNPKAKGPEVDIGATALNVVSKQNPLVELAEDLDMRTATVSGFQLFVPWEKRVISGEELDAVAKETSKILQLALNESQSSKVELSMKEAIDSVIEGEKFDITDSASVHLARCLPSYLLGDYSARGYTAHQLDFGFETVLLDGMGELIDRLVSGALHEAPLHLNLNKAVRQVKVDSDRGKVVVRFVDGTQVLVDAVVLAVPPPLIAAGDIQFEPALPRDFQLAASQLTMFQGNKLIVEFEKAFWPKDVGHFVRAVKSEEERGFLHSWFNVNHVIDTPALSSFLIGPAAERFEKMTDDQVKEAVLSVLSEMFGEAAVAQGGEIVRLQRSAWISDQWSKGCATYPTVGSNPALWDVFSEPLCPGLFFAGEHTSASGQGTLHGAYASGVRAAGQIMEDLCGRREEEERERRAREEAEKIGEKVGEKDEKVDDEVEKDEL